MFKTIKRIIDWCGDFKASLYIGFVFSFLGSWAAAAPVAYSGFLIGRIVKEIQGGGKIDPKLWKIWVSVW